MKNSTKWWMASGLLLLGGGLIAWNARNPNRPLRNTELKQEELTIQQLPPAVQAVIQRESAGGTVADVDKEQDGDRVSYDVEIHKGGNELQLNVSEEGTVRKRKVKPLPATKS